MENKEKMMAYLFSIVFKKVLIDYVQIPNDLDFLVFMWEFRHILFNALINHAQYL